MDSRCHVACHDRARIDNRPRPDLDAAQDARAEADARAPIVTGAAASGCWRIGRWTSAIRWSTSTITLWASGLVLMLIGVLVLARTFNRADAVSRAKDDEGKVTGFDYRVGVALPIA